MATSPEDQPEATPASTNVQQAVRPVVPISVQEFADSLKTDRMIQIHVGNSDDPPFLVQQSILCRASDYFVKAIRNEMTMGRGESGVLRFPSDDVQAWQWMLFWMMKSLLPEKELMGDHDELLALLPRAWMLGDIYILPQFQDLVMLELLKISEHTEWPADIVKSTFEGTMPDTPLRRLVSEEALYLIIERPETLKTSELDDLRTVGVTSSMLAAAKLSAATDYKFGHVSNRLDWNWEEYMLSHGPPASHWIAELDKANE